MQALYCIEARMREARAGPLEIRTARQEHSIPILGAIHTRLQSLQHGHKHLPRSLTGEAISYALGQWEKLCVFLRDGRVQIDNNLVENAICLSRRLTASSPLRAACGWLSQPLPRASAAPGHRGEKLDIHGRPTEW